MLDLATLPGNMRAKQLLSRLLQRPPQALLFVGPEGVGKGKFADLFGRLLLQMTQEDTSPDLRHILPEGKGSHSQEAIQQILEEGALPPYEKGGKVLILHGADHMALPSSHTLLRALEEPLPSTHWILISSQEERLLPTLRSRCFQVPFSRLTEEELMTTFPAEMGVEQKRKIAVLARGSLTRGQALLTQGGGGLPQQMFQVGVGLLRGVLPSREILAEITHPEEALFLLGCFYRDLYLLQCGGDPSFLFYREEREELLHLGVPPPSLEWIQQQMAEGHLAMQLNIPLSHILPLFLPSTRPGP